jgi:SAM-dependent methyltransferase
MLRVVEQAAADRGLANIRTAQGRAERLPFADASFDWVISRYSAHHWRDVDAAMGEMGRVLRPAGQVCLIDVMGGPEPLLDTHLQAAELLRDPSHTRNYTGQEWLDRFRRQGLPAEVTHRWRLPIEFSSWIARIGTAPDRVAAIRALWAGAPAEVREYYSVAGDLSFELDVALLRAGKAGFGPAS